MKACRELVRTRLEEYRVLSQEGRDKAARTLDIGCQFLANMNDMERVCMTNDEWVSEGITKCSDLYLPHVVIFMLKTDWPNTP